MATTTFSGVIQSGNGRSGSTVGQVMMSAIVSVDLANASSATPMKVGTTGAGKDFVLPKGCFVQSFKPTVTPDNATDRISIGSAADPDGLDTSVLLNSLAIEPCTGALSKAALADDTTVTVSRVVGSTTGVQVFICTYAVPA